MKKITKKEKMEKRIILLKNRLKEMVEYPFKEPLSVDVTNLAFDIEGDLYTVDRIIEEIKTLQIMKKFI